MSSRRCHTASTARTRPLYHSESERLCITVSDIALGVRKGGGGHSTQRDESALLPTGRGAMWTADFRTAIDSTEGISKAS